MQKYVFLVLAKLFSELVKFINQLGLNSAFVIFPLCLNVYLHILWDKHLAEELVFMIHVY